MTISVRPRARDGFALPVALLAMIVIGAIVTGGFYVSGQEHDISVSTDGGGRALHVAQYGLEEALATWTNSTIASYTGPITRTLWSGGKPLGEYQIRVMHLGEPAGGSRLYSLESEGRVTRGQQTAVRRVGSFFRTTTAELPYTSAMTVLGQLEAGGNSTISGSDDCTADVVPGVSAVDQSLVTGVMKNPNSARITGAPAVKQEDDMTTATLSTFGELTLSDLIAAATRHIPGPTHEQHMGPRTTTDQSGQTVCDTGHEKNWGGDPSASSGPCSNYYPIIHVDGSLKLDVGKGQGIMIVSGNLEVDGNFEYSGVVIITGSLTMAGNGNKIGGSVIVMGDGELDTESTQSGDAVVQYDSCAVRNALEGNLRVRPLASRAWFADTPPLPAGT
jgi:hypothetical protein